MQVYRAGVASLAYAAVIELWRDREGDLWKSC
jgi:hypothetical protein